MHPPNAAVHPFIFQRWQARFCMRMQNLFRIQILMHLIQRKKRFKNYYKYTLENVLFSFDGNCKDLWHSVYLRRFWIWHNMNSYWLIVLITILSLIRSLFMYRLHSRDFFSSIWGRRAGGGQTRLTRGGSEAFPGYLKRNSSIQNSKPLEWSLGMEWISSGKIWSIPQVLGSEGDRGVWKSKYF